MDHTADEVTVILLNWNGWKHTVECLESLFRSDFFGFRVIVCDNQSTDGSMEKIKAWAEGHLTVDYSGSPVLEPYVIPPVKKPIPFVELDRNAAEAGSHMNGESMNELEPHVRLILIQNGSNSGFSAGNNVGIRYALHTSTRYIWLLNNDTIVRPSTLKELLTQIKSNRRVGLLGASVYFAQNPSRIQTYGGGTVNSVLGIDRFCNSPDGKIDYICGTSLFAKREVFEQIGLLDESFFFYWEDVDFSRRALNAGWKLANAVNAVVYHKFSASVGGQSLKSDLFKVSSFIRFQKKHHRFTWIVPVSFHMSAMLFNRIIRRQMDRVFPIIKQISRSVITAL